MRAPFNCCCRLIILYVSLALHSGLDLISYIGPKAKDKVQNKTFAVFAFSASFLVEPRDWCTSGRVVRAEVACEREER